MLAISLAIITLGGSCGRGRGPSEPARAADTVTFHGNESIAVERQDPFTDEDHMVIAMPLEQRITYLEQKLKDILWERYGITIDENAPRSKNTSLVDDYNKVCEAGVADKELLTLTQTEGKREWTLSFLDRVSGDYDFNHVVDMDDVEALSAVFDDIDGEEGWGYPQSAHIDRLANDDGVISIADITPLAINFGHELLNYNVYWQDYTGGDWRLIGIWDADEMEDNPPYTNYRAQWEGTFTKQSIYRYYASNPIMVDTTTTNPAQAYDRLVVKPVYYDGGVQDIPSDTEYFAWAGTNTAPVADITADPMEADIGEQIDLDASGSTDEDEDTLYFEWDFSTANGLQWFSTGTTATEDCSYNYNSYFTIAVCVTDDVGDWSIDTVQVLVYEIVDPEPPTILSFTPAPIEATLPATITFTTTAQDRDGDIIQSISFDPDGDLTYEDSFTDQDEEFSVDDTNKPPAQRIYTAAYDVEYNRSDTFISNSAHTTNLACRTKAADNDEGEGTAVPYMIRLTHASPTINSIALTNEVGMYVPRTPVTVTINASDASDPDSANDFPTRFDFTFGDGQSYSEEEGSASDGTFDGITTHNYTSSGVFQISVTCYDDDDSTKMGGSCTTPSAHTFTYDWSTDEDEDGKVRIWSTPSVLDGDELIDDGSGNQYVGTPCIAVAINPNTGWPGVAYSSDPTNSLLMPAEVAKFAEKTAESGGWTTPEMVWNGSEIAEHLGYQCDLEYHPTAHSGNVQIPHVVQYFYNQFPSPGGSGGPGLKLYAKMNGDWDCNILVDNGRVDPDSPVRLVVNNLGSFTQFVGEDAFSNVALNEIAFYGESSFTRNSYVQVKSLGGATNVGMSHDLKQFQDDYEGDADIRASLFTVDGATDDVQYKVWNGSSWPGTAITFNSENVDIGTSRHVALDYLGDSEIGAIWIDDDTDLKWKDYDGSWNSEIQLRPSVGDWCDFDYEPILGIPCVAYQEDNSIYLLVRLGGNWQSPIQVCGLNQSEDSHLDLDVHDGYVFIVYSHDDGVYCAVLDFYGGNR